MMIVFDILKITENEECGLSFDILMEAVDNSL